MNEGTNQLLVQLAELREQGLDLRRHIIVPGPLMVESAPPTAQTGPPAAVLPESPVKRNLAYQEAARRRKIKAKKKALRKQQKKTWQAQHG